MVVVINTFPKHPLTARMEAKRRSTTLGAEKMLTFTYKSSSLPGCRVRCKADIQKSPICVVCLFETVSPYDSQTCELEIRLSSTKALEGRMGLRRSNCGHASMLTVDRPLRWPLPLNVPLSVPLKVPLSVQVSVGSLESKAFWQIWQNALATSFLHSVGHRFWATLWAQKSDSRVKSWTARNEAFGQRHCSSGANRRFC